MLKYNKQILITLMVLLFTTPVLMMGILPKYYPKYEVHICLFSIFLLIFILGMICFVVNKIKCEEDKKQKVKADLHKVNVHFVSEMKICIVVFFLYLLCNYIVSKICFFLTLNELNLFMSFIVQKLNRFIKILI